MNCWRISLDGIIPKPHPLEKTRDAATRRGARERRSPPESRHTEIFSCHVSRRSCLLDPRHDDHRASLRVRLRTPDQFPHHPRHVALAEQQEARACRSTASRPSSRSGSPAAGRPSPSPGPTAARVCAIDAAFVDLQHVPPLLLLDVDHRLRVELAGVAPGSTSTNTIIRSRGMRCSRRIGASFSASDRRPGRCGTSTVSSRCRIVSHRNFDSGSATWNPANRSSRLRGSPGHERRGHDGGDEAAGDLEPDRLLDHDGRRSCTRTPP